MTARTNRIRKIETIETIATIEEPQVELLTRFEQKAIDDLAIAMIDPESDASAIESQAHAAATVLQCTPVQAAIAGARAATSVLTVTPRQEGFFGHGDLYFDLDFVREQLKVNRNAFAQPRPESAWDVSRAAASGERLGC